MKTLSAERLLQIWEAGLERNPLSRAIEMLRTAEAAEDPGALPLGARDRRLLDLREETFGAEINGIANCPLCQEAVEMNFRVADVRLPATLVPGPLSVSANGYEVRFRLPTSADLLHYQAEAAGVITQAMAGTAEPAIETAASQPSTWLLGQCVVQASHEGRVVPSSSLPEPVQLAVDQAMAEADPQAEIELALGCQACGHRWQELFDIESFFWTEMQTWAVRMLRDVHLLASAYGWKEQDILRLSPGRRNLYLDLILE